MASRTYRDGRDTSDGRPPTSVVIVDFVGMEISLKSLLEFFHLTFVQCFGMMGT
jgi:hypothetical protein